MKSVNPSVNLPFPPSPDRVTLPSSFKHSPLDELRAKAMQINEQLRRENDLFKYQLRQLERVNLRQDQNKRVQSKKSFSFNEAASPEMSIDEIRLRSVSDSDQHQQHLQERQEIRQFLVGDKITLLQDQCNRLRFQNLRLKQNVAQLTQTVKQYINRFKTQREEAQLIKLHSNKDLIQENQQLRITIRQAKIKEALILNQITVLRAKLQKLEKVPEASVLLRQVQAKDNFIRGVLEQNQLFWMRLSRFLQRVRGRVQTREAQLALGQLVGRISYLQQQLNL